MQAREEGFLCTSQESRVGMFLWPSVARESRWGNFRPLERAGGAGEGYYLMHVRNGSGKDTEFSSRYGYSCGCAKEGVEQAKA